MNALDRYAQAVGHAETLGRLADLTGRPVALDVAYEREHLAQDEAIEAGATDDELDAVEAEALRVVGGEWTYGRPIDDVLPVGKR